MNPDNQLPSAPYVQPQSDMPQPEMITPSDQPDPWWKNLLSIGWFFIVVLFFVFTILTFVMRTYQVVGSSMEPTLSSGDRLIISKLGRTFSLVKGDSYIPSRGDVVVFHNPINPETQYIKRIVGLPGERVRVENGKITVYNDDHPSGFNPDESVDADFVYTTGSIDSTVPEDHIFVVGDNRAPDESVDSRNSLGTVPADEIEGVLFLRIFPIGSAKFF